MLDYVEGPGDGTPEQGGAGATTRGPGDPADDLTNSLSAACLLPRAIQE